MASGVVYIPFYCTVWRQEIFPPAIAEIAPLALRYGATRYQVHQSRDDRYKVTLMAWFDSKDQFYSWYDGPEMIEFRRRWMGKYQVPVVYVWHNELAAGEMGPGVLEPEAELEPAPEATPAA
jgi:hypothetical protein